MPLRPDACSQRARPFSPGQRPYNLPRLYAAGFHSECAHEVSAARRKRFQKVFAKHAEQIRAASREGEIFERLGLLASCVEDPHSSSLWLYFSSVFGLESRLACWLATMDAWYEHLPLLLDMCLLRDAVARHTVPMALWVLRPHLGPLLGRPMPPPDPPDPVLREPRLRGQCERLLEQLQPPVVEEPVKVELPEAPMRRWLKEHGEDQSETGTLDYSTDEEEISPKQGYMLAPVLT